MNASRLPAPAVLEQPLGREPPRAAEDPGARVRARATQVEARDRRGMAPPARHGAHEQDLIESQLALREGALAQSVALLQVEGRPRRSMRDPGLEAWSRRLDRRRDAPRQRVAARGIPGRAVAQP